MELNLSISGTDRDYALVRRKAQIFANDTRKAYNELENMIDLLDDAYKEARASLRAAASDAYKAGK